ncbi:sigma-70 family RNA polymerase sigma factor [Conexibacter sp. W3-3-2]|uniref:RNA polymerase sigma factor n=1 Tax=Conexibacter sp. W3-3-2 TaxID=2675227 RepID=UPI0012B726D2|nr:RNA polymerase sigma factor [Conexibacter sp. W3-3-2]MTD44462.1 sigma-70 family RNA polymerase sigma factor [Conexibacter sp. W3-3-2]
MARSNRPPLDVAALYARLADDLLVFLTRRTGDPEIALDLWAETFALAVEGRRRYRGRSDAEAAGWLYGIARRQLALYHRRGRIERRAGARLQLERPPASPAVLEELTRRAGLAALREDLGAALATLSPAVRDAVTLRVVEELPYPAVAARLGIAEPAARARVSRGLSALADLLDPPTTKEALQP